jgi:predicted ester cyclase
MYKKAFPDLLCTVEDVVAEGEKVAVYWKISATNLGELWGRPPTGKHGEVDVMTLMRLRDGKAVEGRSCYDLIAFRQQVGITTTA